MRQKTMRDAALEPITVELDRIKTIRYTAGRSAKTGKTGAAKNPKADKV